MAMDSIASDSTVPAYERAFVHFIARYLVATNMDFDDVLRNESIARIASAALEAFTVRDPIFEGQVFEAQTMLGARLECKPKRSAYRAWWDVDPFRFDGRYDDQLYDAAVKVGAGAFKYDKQLKAKVEEEALRLFGAIESFGAASGTVLHGGIKFDVICAK